MNDPNIMRQSRMHLVRSFTKIWFQQLVVHVENKGLDMSSLEGATLDEVENTSGSPNDNLLSGAECSYIVAEIGPADAGATSYVYWIAECFKGGVDLSCEDPGRAEYEHYQVSTYSYKRVGRNKRWGPLMLVSTSRIMSMEKNTGLVPASISLIA